MSQWVHNLLALAFGLGGLAVLLGLTPVKDPIIGITLAAAAGVPIVLGQREKAKDREVKTHELEVERKALDVKTEELKLQEPKP